MEPRSGNYKEVVDFYDKKIWTKNDPHMDYVAYLRSDTMFQFVRFSNGDVILDLGCGNSSYLNREEFGNISYLGVDLSFNALKSIPRKMRGRHFILGTNEILPIKGNTINTVMSIAALYYLNEKELISVFKDCFRVLKRNGIVYFTFWNYYHTYHLECRIKRMINGRFYGHFYKPVDIKTMLEGCGFKNITINNYEIYPQFRVFGKKIIPSIFQKKLIGMSQYLISRKSSLRKYSMAFLVSAERP